MRSPKGNKIVAPLTKTSSLSVNIYGTYASFTVTKTDLLSDISQFHFTLSIRKTVGPSAFITQHGFLILKESK